MYTFTYYNLKSQCICLIYALTFLFYLVILLGYFDYTTYLKSLFNKTQILLNVNIMFEEIHVSAMMNFFKVNIM